MAIFISVKACENCNLVINEISTGSPDRLMKKDFIELKIMCDTDTRKIKSTQGYKLIGLSVGGISGNIQQLTVDLIINLWNSEINDRNILRWCTEYEYEL